jgi:uncharacterized protein YkwD
MIYTLITFFLFVISPIDSSSEVASTEEICLSTNERSLFDEINEVRNERGLPTVSLSQSLTIVAKMHVTDLSENEPFDDMLCNPHSWSNQGIWKACCYKSNHSNPECMWKKPSEITDYKGDGYEIVAFWMSGEDPSQEIDHETALQMWLDSPGHSNVILNEMSFSKVEWNAMGIAINGNYASVWFGVEKDNAPPPQFCSN